MTGLQDKVALVTGAGQGIGEAVVWSLAASGASVAAVDCNADGLHAVVGEVTARGLTGRAYPGDVRDAATAACIVTGVERDLGPVDVLVNVAGVHHMAPVVETTDEDWARVFAVNTTGVFHFSREAAQAMAPRRSGCIITVASNAAGVPRMQMAAYAASKAAASSFTKSLGLELARHRIRCNVVCPGSTDTPMQRAMWATTNGQRFSIDGSLDAYRVGIPLRKLATPQDVADAVLFLASEQAGHITMQDIYVDGGATLRA